MKTFQFRVPTLAAGLLYGLAASGGPVTFDFTGTGFVCTAADNGGCGLRYDGAFTGSITVEILADGPSGADSYSDGTSLAYDYNGWVQSDFLIQWDGNSFSPGPVAGQAISDYYVQLLNDWGYADNLAIRENYMGRDGTTNYYSSATLVRQTGDLSWLSGLTLPPDLGFAPGGFNQITFANYSETPGEFGSLFAGISGTIDLSSMTIRSASVPEPSTLALFGLGLAGLGLSRRRRISRLPAR